uniref:Cationic amino acid transporter C-terminal domain-containing protein n=1 Tax=Sus scrofa TaxID=9823 RepID=A0A8D1SRP1_PIG
MLRQYVCQFCEKLVRRWPLEPRKQPEGGQAPHLNTLDLVARGVGSTLGAGVYIVAGAVAASMAGPAIIVSFLVAALPSVLSGLCYAEIGTRVPVSGSACLYSYISVGQFCAFLAGWNLILGYVTAIASVAKAWSSTFDSLIWSRIAQVLWGTLSQDIPSFLAPYPDFFALGLVLLLTGMLALGAHESALVTKVFSAINLLVLSFIILSGFIKGDLHNWQLTEQDYKLAAHGSNDTSSLGLLGSGGFVPFGFEGILQGAATCYYVFVGFDDIVTKVAEAQNPQRSIPWSIMITICLCFLMCVPALGTETQEGKTPHPMWLIREKKPQSVLIRHILTHFSIFCSSLLGDMFPMLSVIDEMEEEGLIFWGLSQRRTGTPIMALLTFGMLAGVTALFFKLRDLVHLTLIGTLLAYSLVALSVLVLRYQPDQNFTEESPLESVPDAGTSNPLKSLCNPISPIPTQKSGQIVYGCAFLLVLLLTILSLLLALWPSRVFSGDPGFTAGAVLLLLLIAGITAIIWRQPQNPSPLPFRVPALPILPVLSIFVNVYLMMQMSSVSWAQFGIWNVLGLAIYFGYGIRHSPEEKRDSQLPASTSQTLHEHTPSAEIS